MAGSVDSRREAVWGQRLRRFEKSRLTVAAFCRAEGVSAPSFYHWRKRLAERDREAVLAKRVTESFVPVRLTAGPAPRHGPAAVEIHCPTGCRCACPG
jgi:transposase-like protein